MRIAESKKTVWKGCNVYFKCMTFWNSKTSKDVWKDCRGFQQFVERQKQAEAGDIQDDETILYDNVMVLTLHAFFKFSELFTKDEP